MEGDGKAGINRGVEGIHELEALSGDHSAKNSQGDFLGSGTSNIVKQFLRSSV